MSRGYVLVADDDDLLLELVVTILTREGYDVATASNGALCLALIERRIPDLILLDACMPVQDGFDTLRALKASPVLKQVPVLMLTAQRGVADIVKAKSLGVLGYIAKPFEPGHLARQIAAAIRVHQSLCPVEQRPLPRTPGLPAEGPSQDLEFLD